MISRFLTDTDEKNEQILSFNVFFVIIEINHLNCYLCEKKLENLWWLLWWWWLYAGDNLMVVIFAINLSFSVYVTFNVVWCLQCPVSSVQCPGQKIKQNFKFSTLLSTEKKVFGYKDFFFFDDSYLLFFLSYHNIFAISRFFLPTSDLDDDDSYLNLFKFQVG